MAAETAALRTLARRVKQKTLERAIYVLDNPDKVTQEVYDQTYLTALRNAVPRSQEITGEDGEQLVIKVTNFGNSDSIPISTEIVSTGILTSSTEVQDSGNPS